ncbi:MAG: hypothetical protein ACD_39C01159G0001 [uncultured bacterium]|nr:MAG: hypothetical protein ACD_39C01159G0001 [uncultured bacterium]
MSDAASKHADTFEPLDLVQLLLHQIFLSNITEHHDNSDDFASLPSYRSRRICNLVFFAISRDQNRMIGKPDDFAESDHVLSWKRSRFSRSGVNNDENFRDVATGSLCLAPTRQPFSDRVHEHHFLPGICSNDRVTDRIKGCQQLFLTGFEQIVASLYSSL